MWSNCSEFRAVLVSLIKPAVNLRPSWSIWSKLQNIQGKFNQFDLRKKNTCNLIGFILSSGTHFQVSIFKVLASWKCSQVIRFIRFDYRFSNWSFWELNLRLKKNALIFHSRLKIFKSAITTSRTTPSTD